MFAQRKWILARCPEDDTVAVAIRHGYVGLQRVVMDARKRKGIFKNVRRFAQRGVHIPAAVVKMITDIGSLEPSSRLIAVTVDLSCRGLGVMNKGRIGRERFVEVGNGGKFLVLDLKQPLG